MSLRLKVVTPTRLMADCEVTELTAPGVEGEMGVLPEHVTLLGALETGLLSYVEAGESKHIVVHGGYAEVEGADVTILADDGELPHEIDAEEARNSLAEAGKRLAEANDPEVVASLVAELRRAEVRVAALA